MKQESGPASSGPLTGGVKIAWELALSFEEDKARELEFELGTVEERE